GCGGRVGSAAPRRSHAAALRRSHAEACARHGTTLRRERLAIRGPSQHVEGMHAKLDPPSLESVLGSASAVAAGRLAGAGPAGRLPLTPDMLREEPSGNVFGLTQNVGMGWSPASLDGPQYVIVSTHGGLRSEDG